MTIILNYNIIILKIILKISLILLAGDGCVIYEMIPEWILNLEEEDFVFIKKFIIISGSLKELASIYNVTYPTVRLRLDKLIQKIKLEDGNTSVDKYVTLIKTLAINEKLDLTTAKLLISEYKKTRKEL